MTRDCNLTACIIPSYQLFFNYAFIFFFRVLSIYIVSFMHLCYFSLLDSIYSVLATNLFVIIFF
jgi:hypothetical protein